MRNWLLRVRASLALLVERRVGLFLTIDGFFLFSALPIAFGAGEGRASEFWIPMFLAPSLIIGVPMLSECVAVERRSGTLDLALSSPGARFYFERRAGAVAVLMIVQGWFGVLVSRVSTEPFPFTGPLIQIVIVSLFIASVTLNWSLRLATPGSVIFATYATIAVFFPWFFSNPIYPPAFVGHPMTADDIIKVTKDNLVLAGAAGVFYLYSLQRLMRPETIIT
jgi:hypothetical protein